MHAELGTAEGHRMRGAGGTGAAGPLPVGLQFLRQAFDLPLVTSVGYETPGSFGSWCADLSLPCITAEFPPISSDEASEKYLNAMMELLRWQPQR